MENKPHKHSIGILKETKDNERRVVLTPNCVRRLCNNGFKVFVEEAEKVGPELRILGKDDKPESMELMWDYQCGKNMKNL